MTTNLFDYFEEVPAAGAGALATPGDAHARPAAGPADGASPWAARAPRIPNERFDIKLVPRRQDWRQGGQEGRREGGRDPSLYEGLERIEAEPWAGALRIGEDGVELRLADAWIESTGAALEAGGGDEVELADLARGGRYAIQFWDANATKALHVGHLRNLALGNALAAALEQAGGEVERRSVISDAGRSMGEAMAGIVQSGHHTSAWPDGDQKSDHFVGLCYADYVASGGNTFEAIDEREDSLTRELRMRNDAADELLKRVLAGESEALELWFKTRAWVIAGQRKTLARLGIAFDRVFFESDFLDDGAELVERGLREGIVQRREDGVVLYATGVQEMQEMPLLRADGQTTQHMRAVSYWMGSPALEGVTTIQITGTEWVAHGTCIRKLMTELSRGQHGAAAAGNGAVGQRGVGTQALAGSASESESDPGNGLPPRGVHPTLDVFHGMVAQQKRAVSSSDEGGLLIDDLIEWIEQRIDADEALREVRRAHPAPERIPAQIALGYFLPYPMTPRVNFEIDKLLTERESLGWDLVRARAKRGGHPKGRTPGGAGRLATAPARPAEDPDYRSAVVQSEIYRRHLRLAVQRYDVTPVALYLRHLARWYQERERSGHVERVIHTLLDRCARGLGLEAGR